MRSRQGVGGSGRATRTVHGLSSLGCEILEDSGKMGYSIGVFIGVLEDWRDRCDIQSNSEHRIE